jgi:hypothetical protein
MGPDSLAPVNTDEAMAMLQELRYIRTVPATSDAEPLMRAPVPANWAPASRAGAGVTLQWIVETQRQAPTNSASP